MEAEPMKTTAFTKTYGGATVLTMPSVELKPGTVTAVIGANGSGKSTLAKVLAGLEPADKKTRAGLDARVGYLPQKSFAFRMSLQRNIALNGADTRRAAQLTEVLGLAPLLKRSAKRLSGGETAKMALSRLLMADYDVLILDEPTAAMDMESTLSAEKLITAACRETNCAVLLITHSLAQAERTADRVLFLHRGRLVEQGDSKSILNHPKEAETIAFLEFYGA
jgi:ABC-type multidrug transport system ATPase subunit